MQAHAMLVNTARGAIVDTEALVMALEAGEIGGAGPRRLRGRARRARVAPRERRARSCSPHIGSATTRARDAMARTAALNVLAVLGGSEPPNPVVEAAP